MKPRIELHAESSYSYKNLGSVITPADLLAKARRESLEVIGIVDYCSCSIIPVLENLKRQMQLDSLKIIYGITLNIKYDNLYVPTVILAKNDDGIKSLYQLVTKLNEDECYFILQEDLDKYKDNLILGISKFNLEEDYSKVLKYYEYVEVTPGMSKEEVLKINEYCKENNLLLVATSKPTRLEKDDTLARIMHETNPQDYPIKEENYYYSTEELLDKFKYLANANDVVVENAYKISDKITDYNLDFTKRYMFQIEDKKAFVKDVLERANLIYIEDIPKNVMDRLNYELEIIQKYDLEGTISIIENIVHKAKRLGGYATVGSFFSHSLVAYLLGLVEINPMDLEFQGDFLNDFKKYGFRFEINVSENIKKELIDFYRGLVGIPNNYQKSTLSGQSSLILKNKVVENEQKLIKQQLKEIKRKTHLTPSTYYLIPKNVNILDITPISNNSFSDLYNTKTLDFSDTLKHSFVSLYFRSNFILDKLWYLEEKSKIFWENIPLDDEKVLKNTYLKVKSNEVEDYKSFIHYNINNNYAPKLKICLGKNEKEPNSLYDLINLPNDNDLSWEVSIKKQYYGNSCITYNETDPRWLAKVMDYYYDSYYLTYYEKEYYEVYLRQIVEDFRKYHVYEDNFLNEFESNYKNKTIQKIIEDERDAVMELIMQIMVTMYDKNLDDIIWRLAKSYKEESGSDE